MRLRLLSTICLAILPLSGFAEKIMVGRVKVCQERSLIEKPLVEKSLKEKPQISKPALERIKLEKTPSAIEGIRASMERPMFERPEFDKSTYEDNCDPKKVPSSNLERLLEQRNLPPEIARMIRDAIKGKHTPKPGECPCTATVVPPAGKGSN